MGLRGGVLPVAMLAALSVPSQARAEWSLAIYLGASHTAPTTLTLEQPAARVHLQWHDVPFESRSFESPQYYGYRIAWFRSPQSKIGVEAEFIHLKLYARSGALAPEVQRFSISHGLNLVLANAVWRAGDPQRRLHLQVRAGAGVTVPHAESEIFGIAQEQYELSSAALQVAAGPELRLTRHIRTFAEYKLTTAAPTVSVPGGTMAGRYTSQHIAFGLGAAW